MIFISCLQANITHRRTITEYERIKVHASEIFPLILNAIIILPKKLSHRNLKSILPVNVFISSTYRDLAEYREVLRLALETSGYHFLGMEHFPAQQAPPIEVALATLQDCSVYVAIIGELYGSSPPGRVLSYTELEYKRAIELGMYTIILIMEDNALVHPAYVERDPEKLKRLHRFRSKIMRDHVIQTFANAHEAAWKVLAGLRQYETRLQEQQG